MVLEWLGFVWDTKEKFEPTYYILITLFSFFPIILSRKDIKKLFDLKIPDCFCGWKAQDIMRPRCGCLSFQAECGEEKNGEVCCIIKIMISKFTIHWA